MKKQNKNNFDLLEKYIVQENKKTSILLYNEKFEVIYKINEDLEFCTASLIKIAVGQLALENPRITEEEMMMVEKMICQSDNASTSYLWGWLGGGTEIQSFFDQLGMARTKVGKQGSWGLSEITSQDTLLLWKYIIEQNNPYILECLKNVIEKQKWGISTGVPNESTVYIKNGWLPITEDNWRVNTTGYIEGEESYGLIILTEDNLTVNQGIAYVEQITNIIKGNFNQ
jgi:hypothetical protein